MIFKFIGVTIGILGIITPFAISQRNRRLDAIEEFKNTFLDEKYKITTSRDVQDFGLQENAIISLNNIINLNDITAIRTLWEDYKKAENKYNKATPSPGTVVIHYGDHKLEILSKIDKIIDYLK